MNKLHRVFVGEIPSIGVKGGPGCKKCVSLSVLMKLCPVCPRLQSVNLSRGYGSGPGVTHTLRSHFIIDITSTQGDSNQAVG